MTPEIGFRQHGDYEIGIHSVKGLDCRMDVVKPCAILSLKIIGKGINFVQRRGITDSLICQKLVVLELVVEHLKALNNFWRHILYISLSRYTFMFVNGYLSRSTFIVEKQHFNNLSVGSISMHNITFAEPCFISMISDQLENNITMSFNISQSISLSIFHIRYCIKT